MKRTYPRFAISTLTLPLLGLALACSAAPDDDTTTLTEDPALDDANRFRQSVPLGGDEEADDELAGEEMETDDEEGLGDERELDDEPLLYPSDATDWVAEPVELPGRQAPGR